MYKFMPAGCAEPGLAELLISQRESRQRVGTKCDGHFEEFQIPVPVFDGLLKASLIACLARSIFRRRPCEGWIENSSRVRLRASLIFPDLSKIYACAIRKRGTSGSSALARSIAAMALSNSRRRVAINASVSQAGAKAGPISVAFSAWTIAFFFDFSLFASTMWYWLLSPRRRMASASKSRATNSPSAMASNDLWSKPSSERKPVAGWPLSGTLKSTTFVSLRNKAT